MSPGEGKRHGTRNGVGGEPGRNGKHGGAAVLQLLGAAVVGDLNVEGVPSDVPGEAAGLEAGRNGLVLGELAVLVRQLVDLGDGDQGEHLGEAPGGDVPHGLEGGHGGEVGELDALGHGEVVVGADFVEGEAGPVDAVPDGGKHGGPAVLDLGGADELAGLLRTPVLSQFLPHTLAEESCGPDGTDGFGIERGGAGGMLPGRGEGGGGGGEGEGGEELHGSDVRVV